MNIYGYVCVYIWICVRVVVGFYVLWIYIHMHVRVHIHTYTHTLIKGRINVPLFVQDYVHEHIHTHRAMCIHAYILSFEISSNVRRILCLYGYCIYIYKHT